MRIKYSLQMHSNIPYFNNAKQAFNTTLAQTFNMTVKHMIRKWNTLAQTLNMIQSSIKQDFKILKRDLS